MIIFIKSEIVLKPCDTDPHDISSNITWLTQPQILVIFFNYLWHESTNPWLHSPITNVSIGETALWFHELLGFGESNSTTTSCNILILSTDLDDDNLFIQVHADSSCNKITSSIVRLRLIYLCYMYHSANIDLRKSSQCLLMQFQVGTLPGMTAGYTSRYD